MNDVDQLVARLSANDPREVSAAAQALGALGDRRAVEPLLALLQRATDPATRDAAALALRDLGDARALDPLLGLLADPSTEVHRGTLVYALGGFDCRGIVRQLVNLIITGNFEVSRQAFSVLEAIEGDIDPRDWQASLDTLHGALPAASEEKRGLLRELLTLFDTGET